MHTRCNRTALLGLLVLFSWPIVACAGAARTSDAFSSPPILDAAAFNAATEADLAVAGEEVEGRAAEAPFDAPAVDTFNSPAPLTVEEFAAATSADAAREVAEEPVELEAAHDLAGSAAKLTQITLTKELIDQLKNRATLTIQFQVVGASRVHGIDKGGDDGDIHIGGIANDVGLPCVVEIVNAKDHPDEVDMAKELIDDQEVTEVTGAWRIWCEHPGVPQVQFNTPYHGPDSNPDHVLEIHPTSEFGGSSLLNSFVPIPGYVAYDAKKAFDYYESVICELQVDDETVTILTPRALYNYAEFEIEIEDDAPLIVPDGRFIRCSVLDAQHNVVTSNRRMVFVKNTAPEKAVRTLNKGDRMHVLGIPRANLAVIAWRAENAAARPEVLTWRLPYEMIVVAEL